ncbi:MAG: geranyl transferase [Gammaproteobacteria bacterium HGW-Gammaproteobacteria-6]|nr:MAG: geranyl transferase [Gammaproteobacteria bacterium HGW-Gammaproteobacteria-6]
MLTHPAFTIWLARIEHALNGVLPEAERTPTRLHAAMRHAVLSGGKRLRPLLVYAAGAIHHADEQALDAGAVAVELIHAYSLVHDDLPAMDNDALRRGIPTVHIAFDEATAILAGDALQALAFECLSRAPADADVRVKLLHTLAVAAGSAGMCGGQALDLEATGQQQPISALQRMHRAKTGALIQGSVRIGALLGGASPGNLTQLDAYANALGLAFQIRDDLLDIEGNTAQLGKTAGKDAAQNKSTFPSVLGIAASRQQLDVLAAEMQSALSGLDTRAEPLRELARFAVQRAH